MKSYSSIINLLIGIVFFLFTFFSSAKSQGLEWAFGFGSSYQNFGLNIAGDFVAVDDSGNVYVTGLYNDSVDFDPGPGVTLMVPQGNDAFIVKLNAAGNFVWVKTFTGSGFLEPDELIFDHQGNLLLTGRFIYDVDFDPGPSTAIETVSNEKRFALVKLTTNGDLLWYRISEPSLPMMWGASIACDSNDDILILSSFSFQGDADPGPGVVTIIADITTQFFILKLDSAGNFLWVNSSSGVYNSYVRPMDLKLDSHGSIYATGWFRDSIDFDPGPGVNNLFGMGFSDAFLLKLDSSGNFIWAQSYGGNAQYAIDQISAIAFDNSNFVYITGSFRGVVDFDFGPGTNTLSSPTSESVFFGKLDSNGLLQWVRSLPDSYYSRGVGITIDCAGSVYLNGMFGGTLDLDPGTGTQLVSSSFREGFFGKYTPNGDLIWAFPTGGLINDEYITLIQDSYGYVYAYGYCQDSIDLDPGPGSLPFIADNQIGVYLQKFMGCSCISQNDHVCFGSDYTFPDGVTIQTIISQTSHTSIFPSLSGCDSVIITSLTVDSLPLVQLNDFNIDTLCTNATPIPLPSGTPAGGTYSGSGISGSFFDPGMVVPGNYTIYYSYVDSNQCENSDSTDITVDLCSGDWEQKEPASFRLYPNPVRNEITIDLVNAQSQKTTIAIYNVFGELVRELYAGKDEMIKWNAKFDLSELQSGVYLLTVNGSTNFTRRIIKL